MDKKHKRDKCKSKWKTNQGVRTKNTNKERLGFEREKWINDRLIAQGK